MNDDDVIREAVHELVAAAPPPKPLPMGGASSGGRYRWLAVAAAAILVVGGIMAIAWSRADDDGTSVATTLPETVPTPPPTTEVTPGPEPTSPVTVTTPPTVPPTVETVPATTSTTTTSTTTTSTTTLPPTPEQAQLQEYFAALAEGRYDDAALLLREGGLEYERRWDVRPLFTEYGDVDDLPARLRSWCEEEAICTVPDGPPVDIGNLWVATWTVDGAALTGYFRSGSYEGSPSVSGLPPRRTSVQPRTCPTTSVEAVREGDVDGDGSIETIVVTGAGGGNNTVDVCNTGLELPELTVPAANVVIGVMQTVSDPSVTLLIGDAGEAGVCAATYRMAQSAGALVQVGWDGCWGIGTGESIGCRDVNGEAMIVAYRYSFVGGDGFDDSTAIDVEVLSLDGAALDAFTLALPDQAEEALTIVEPYCNGLPVVTEG
jgi:hypothetical protein